jgi:phosphatidylserine/phosphatidylglycerophosphate/cardiolipin synthase-like enzyme
LLALLQNLNAPYEADMKSKLPRFLAVFLLIVSTMLAPVARSEVPATRPAPTSAPATTQPSISIETHFAPEEKIAPTIVKLIDDAHGSLDVAAFAFTHADIAAALIRAHQRGVRVRMVTDIMESSSRYSRVPDLMNAGIPVRTRRKDGDQHSKYLVIDQSIVVTGSFNFTARADERNSENLLIIRNAPNVVKGFSADFQILLEDSVRKANGFSK